ncbi:MAG: trypsin-like serine protease [Bacteroidetes bacterium]|nr:trypsin-like serine protease [Bacteroidota bacterium]
MVCSVGGGVGTLIDPRWVLTAAHVAESLPGNAAKVRFGSKVIVVSKVYIHPPNCLFPCDNRHRGAPREQAGGRRVADRDVARHPLKLPD